MVHIFCFNYRYFGVYSISYIWWRRITQNPKLAAAHVRGSIWRDGPPHNWHTDGVPTGVPANAHWQSWASMASVQASSTSEYLSPVNIGQGVFVNMIVSMNLFTTSKVTIWCWGTVWSALAVGCGTFWTLLDLRRGSAWAHCAQLNSDNLLRRVDFWLLSSGGAIAPPGFGECRSGGHAMTALARLKFFSSGTIVVCVDFSPRT